MKLVKTTLYAFSHENPEEPLAELNDLIDHCDYATYKIFDCDIDEVEIGEWYDEHPLNFIDIDKDTYERFFSGEDDFKLVADMVDAVDKIMQTSKYTKITQEEAIALVKETNRELNKNESNAFVELMNL